VLTEQLEHIYHWWEQKKLYNHFGKLLSSYAAGRRTKRETDRLCSDIQTGRRDEKAERKNLKN
jgi:hypothetical protein